MIVRPALALLTLAVLTACGGTAAGPGGSADEDDNKGGTIPVPALADIAGSYTAVNTAQSPKPLVAGTQVTLRITGETITVNAGCNTLSGPARAVDSHLVVDQPAMTEMGCDRARMDQDAWLADYLTNRPRLDWSGPYVSLVWSDGWLGFDRSLAPEPSPTGDPDTPVSNTPSG